GGHTRFDRRGDALGQAHHRDQSDQQQAETDVRGPRGRRVGVFLLVDDLTRGGDRQEVVTVPAGLHGDEEEVQAQRRDGGEAELRGGEPGAGGAGGGNWRPEG